MQSLSILSNPRRECTLSWVIMNNYLWNVPVVADLSNRLSSSWTATPNDGYFRYRTDLNLFEEYIQWFRPRTLYDYMIWVSKNTLLKTSTRIMIPWNFFPLHTWGCILVEYFCLVSAQGQYLWLELLQMNCNRILHKKRRVRCIQVCLLIAHSELVETESKQRELVHGDP